MTGINVEHSESYFEYILKRCSFNSIRAISSRHATKAALLDEAKKGFNGSDYILGEKWLIDASRELMTSKKGYFDYTELNDDGKKVFRRCNLNIIDSSKDLDRGNALDKENVFNTLVDLNWLISSKKDHVNRSKNGKVSLLESPIDIIQNLKEALLDIYDCAMYYKDRSNQYSKATSFKYQFFSGLHPDQEVRSLFAEGYTGLDFENLRDWAKLFSISQLALYYALTATAARTCDIWRRYGFLQSK